MRTRVVSISLACAFACISSGCGPSPAAPTGQAAIASFAPEAPARLPQGQEIPDYSGLWRGQGKRAGCRSIGPCRSDFNPYVFERAITQSGADLIVGGLSAYVTANLGIYGRSADQALLLTRAGDGFAGVWVVDNYNSGGLASSFLSEVTLQKVP